ncbi:DMT family transporter [Paenibacillus alba]|uniref:DMT family transporter n=1 Tax=Paenibacillus alba TaxID=1197127 RepID=UPI0015633383|nr:DMT family transporter [Paenibacillus alba]NQX71462.1 DMT family transporter [Paenibacillus alba]
MGLLLGLLSALFFGSADFVAAKSSKQIGVYATLLYMQIVGVVLLTIFLVVTGKWQFLSSYSSLAKASLWMFVDLAGILMLYRGLQVGKTSVVAPIVSSFSVVTVILAISFGERESWITFVGIVLTVVGVMGVTLSGPETDDLQSQRVKLAKGVIWAILASLCLGVAFFGLRYPVEEIGGLATVWIGRLQGSVLLAFIALGVKRKTVIPKKKELNYLILVGVLDTLAILSYNIGLIYEMTSIVITAASLFAVFTLVWGILINNERLAMKQWAGVVLTFIGIVIVSIG